MAEGIVYLGVDDEITSAAQRIRSAPGTKVALVVPYGSRIATSRMNFRLLSREALVSNRRLSIVSGDAGSRSLAASAGLPVFGSVQEYESSLAQAKSDAAAGAGSADAPGADEGVDPPGGAMAPSGATLAASETVVRPPTDGAAAPTPARKSQRPRRPTLDSDETTMIPTLWAPGSTAAGPETAAPSSAGSGVPARRSVAYDPDRGRDRDRERPRDDEGVAAVADRPTTARRRVRTPILAGLGLVGLAAIVLAVGAYLFLPSASISLVPRREPIGPISIDVSADPAATDVDVAAGVIPALRLEIPVEAARTFPTMGMHVKEVAARGSVTFTNYDFQDANSVPSGSYVSTGSGIRYRTLGPVLLPAATRIGVTIVPTTRSVDVAATKPGLDGNVPANSIRIVPEGEDPNSLSVNNRKSTTGGTHTETPEIGNAEVDKAVAAVQTDLQAAFDEAVAAGTGAPVDATVFPQTAVPGTAMPAVDPKSLIGQAIDSFEIRLAAKGTVLAVDTRPVRAIAEARLADAVGAGHRLVDGSVAINVGEGSVGEDGGITFQATARATRVTIVDPAPLRDLVRNRNAADAKAALAPYGEATVALWPDWVNIVTSMDSRLEVTVVDGGTGTKPAATGSPAPTRSPARPSPSPGDSEVPSSGDAPSAPAAP